VPSSFLLLLFSAFCSLLLAAGHTSKEIAEKMHLGYETVCSYRKNLQTKLGVHSTVELTRIALDRKLV
jgi:DNA-binding CsgD family transcriptional regulator